MGRTKKKPEYDPERIQNEMIEIVQSLYCWEVSDDLADEDIDDVPGDITGHHVGNLRKSDSKRSLRSVADELGISMSKVVKLLITGGIYSSDMAKTVNELYASGKTVQEIQNELGVSRATVHSYLPYRKGIYSTKETSVNADRIRKYRERCRCIEELQEDRDETHLWNAVMAFQGYKFYTVTGLKYTYALKMGRDGSYNRELMVSRRTESKTLAWSSVMLAFDKALKMQGQVVERPKALGDIRGVSYIYPMFYRFGLIEVPERASEKMQHLVGRVN